MMAAMPMILPNGVFDIYADVNYDKTSKEVDYGNNSKLSYIASKEAEETFEGRSKIVVSEAVTNGEMLGVTKKFGGYVAEAFFERGDINKGIMYAKANLDAGNDMFHLFNVMSCYANFKQYYPDWLKNDVKNKIVRYNIVNPSTGVWEGSSENHRLMLASSGFMAGQEWPDAFPQAVYQYCADYLSDWCSTVVRTNCWEYDSSTYFIHHTSPLLMIAQYAEDEQLRNKAELALEWYIASIAPEYLDGTHIGTEGRDKNPNSGPKFTPDESEHLWWLLFGGGPSRSFDDAYVGAADILSSVTFASAKVWQMPEIFRKIARDRDTPFTHREYSAKAPWLPYKTTYMNKDYGVCSEKSILAPNYEQKQQSNHWAVIWKTGGAIQEPGAFFIKNPYKMNILSGESNAVQVLQKDGTLVSVYNIDNGINYIEGPFCDWAYKAVLEEKPETKDGWIFMNTGTVLIGVKTINPYYFVEDRTLWTTYANRQIFPATTKYLRSDGAKNGVIVETAPISDYSGATAEETLRNFAAAVLAQSVDAEGISGPNPTLKYTSVYGDEMEISWTNQGGTRKINDEIQVFDNNWPLLGNPWMHQMQGDKKLTISYMDEYLEYDFDRWVKSDTPIVEYSAPVINHTPPKAVQAFHNTEISAEIIEGTPMNGDSAQIPESTIKATVYYSFGGAYNKSDMEQVNENCYSVFLPGGTPGSTLKYYIKAESSLSGKTATWMFSDDFVSAPYTAENWTDVPAKWNNVKIDDRTCLKVVANGSQTLMKNPAPALQDYELEFLAQYSNIRKLDSYGEYMEIYFRANQDLDCYAIKGTAKDNGTVEFVVPVYRKNVYAGRMLTASSVAYAYDPTQWHNYRLSVQGNVFTFYIDGNQVFTVSDAQNEYHSGGVGFKSRYIDLLVDDLSIAYPIAVLQGDSNNVVISEAVILDNTVKCKFSNYGDAVNDMRTYAAVYKGGKLLAVRTAYLGDMENGDATGFISFAFDSVPDGAKISIFAWNEKTLEPYSDKYSFSK